MAAAIESSMDAALAVVLTVMAFLHIYTHKKTMKKNPTEGSSFVKHCSAKWLAVA